MDLTLYFAPQSCAFVTLVALEACGHSFAVETVALVKGEQRRADFLALNPAGKVPVLVVDGRPMTESVAILVWLSGCFPEARLLPDPGDFRGRTEVLADLAFFASTLQGFTPRIRLPHRICDADPERVRAQAVAQAALQFDWIEARLAADRGECGWWYGAEWSLVDAYLGWIWLAVSRPPGLDAAAYPALGRHAQRGLQHPAVRRALAREQALMAASAPPGR